MLSAGFTPGPWGRVGDGRHIRALAPDGDGYVCDIYLAEDDPEVIANANLIAAAPDMFEALTRWSNAMAAAGVWPVKDANDPFQDALAQTHEALAKARGEQVSA